MRNLKTFFELIQFEHTAFALPFAYLGVLLGSGGHPTGRVFFWVTLAMVGARTAGMMLNRLIDREMDKLNPRTRNRPLVTGRFPVGAAWAVAAAALVIFFLSAYFLNALCFKLSFFAMVLLFGYHYVKRFSFLSHFVLGAVLGAAPFAGWIAATGVFSWLPVGLSLAVLFWVAGFDILYSLQDLDFDRLHGLHSVPVRFGQAASLKISAACHGLTIGFLALFGMTAGRGILYGAGVLLCAILLWIEHGLVSEGDLSRLGTAFFTLNGWMGILLFIFTFLDTYR